MGLAGGEGGKMEWIHQDFPMELCGINVEHKSSILEFWEGNSWKIAELQWAIVESPLGPLRILFKKPYVIGIALGPSPEGEESWGEVKSWNLGLPKTLAKASRIPRAQESEWVKRAESLCHWISMPPSERQGGGGPAPGPGKIQLALIGSTFQLKVWKVLLGIPWGQTASYQWVAQQLGQPKAMRAVGRAVGGNPLAWVVPCHRILPASGGWGGFRWGVENKKKLLLLEKNI